MTISARSNTDDHRIVVSGGQVRQRTGKGGGVNLRLIDVKDSPPEFALLPKDSLRIDPAYQRRAGDKRVKDIAANWSWIACGALKVTLRADGNWFVFDGQHRLLAALLRADVRELPCLIYDTKASLEEEARGFLAQTIVKPMYHTDRFKAMVVARDPIALFLNELFVRDGFAVRVGGKTSHSISCVGLLSSLAGQNRTQFLRLWPLIAKIADLKDGYVNERIVSALWYIESRLADDDTITSARWTKRILSLGFQDMTDSCYRYVAVEKADGARSNALGLLAIINHGLRQRLEIPGLNA